MAQHRLGLGRRGKAEKWQLGVSGRQNKALCPPINGIFKVCCLFGDSQLRGFVQKDAPPPNPHRRQLIINCTPGGKCADVATEIRNFIYPYRPRLLMVEAGTNDLGRPVEDARQDFHHLLEAAKKVSEVVAFSILPRLDRLGSVVPVFNKEFERTAIEAGVSWVDLTARFPVQDLRCWAGDGLHLSDCTGLPRLAAEVSDVCCSY
ncbi:uncharacterized protein [Diadema setosum]|uniref:uncharacterized protein n=1 Tax=Diadema setosum TaxID=31175 RepID=UPI003B3A019E